jgi:hypothetical protein
MRYFLEDMFEWSIKVGVFGIAVAVVIGVHHLLHEV